MLSVGTAHPKRIVTAKHGAVRGIDDILNYLKENDDAPCPWRAGPVKKAVPGCQGRGPLEDGAFLGTLIPMQSYAKWRW